MKDDLSSSVGAVMDLLGELSLIFISLAPNQQTGTLVTYEKVIQILGSDSVS
jgi:hypothetical protein